MQRRDFFRQTTLAALAPTLPAAALAPDTVPPRTRKAARIRPGATVGIISVGYPLADGQAERALANLAALGFKAKPFPHWRDKTGYLAGTDADRLADLHAAFADPEVEVVWCARGGYGSTRLLPNVDYDLIKRHPKPFIGYSDITALHAAFGEKTGLVTFHGPGASAELPDFALEHWKAVLLHGATNHVIAPETVPLSDAYTPYVLKGGRAEGRTVGGNLSLLSALAGTPYSPCYKDKIVFIEDVEERPYSLDRMLVQLLQGTNLAKAAGIALGVFIDCEAKGDSPSFTMRETLNLCLGGLSMPIVYGLPIGHMTRQATVPCGVRARLDTNPIALTLLESGVL